MTTFRMQGVYGTCELLWVVPRGVFNVPDRERVLSKKVLFGD